MAKPVYNYRQKHRLPTKKEEREFIKNLKPSERAYSYKDLKPPEELFKSGDWEGVVYEKKMGRLEKMFLWLAYKSSNNKDRNKKWYKVTY